MVLIGGQVSSKSPAWRGRLARGRCRSRLSTSGGTCLATVSFRPCGGAIYRAKCGPNCPPPITPSAASKHPAEAEMLVAIRRDLRDKSRRHMV